MSALERYITKNKKYERSLKMATKSLGLFVILALSFITGRNITENFQCVIAEPAMLIIEEQDIAIPYLDEPIYENVNI